MVDELEQPSMGSIPRVFDPNSVYHVVNRGNNKSGVFLAEGDYLRFLAYLRDVRSCFGIDIFHYCLMPNHVHLLLRPNGNLSKAMHGVFMPFAKWFCKKYDRSGHVWQGPFRPTPVLSDAHLYASGNYIEMNPVRAGLVNDPGAWSHSSYGHYAYGKHDPLITENPFYGNLGPTDGVRRSAYLNNIANTRC
jgi:putative transposase